MVKVRGRNSNRKTVKQTVKMAEKSRVTTPRGRHESWCQASAVRGCVPILINPEFDAALDRDSGVTHWMSSPGSALWCTLVCTLTSVNLFFFFFFFLCRFVSVVWQDSDRVQSVTQGTYYSGRSSMLSSDSWLIDIGERSHPNPMHRRLIRCSSATSKTGNGFGWSFFFAVWRRCARSQLHMNSVVLVERQGRCALVRIARLQKFDRRNNMIFTVHLNRLIDENTPLEQSTIETCLQEAYNYKVQVPESYENFLWHLVKVRSIVTRLRHDHERDDDRSHRRVSIMSSLDAGWFRLITNILIQSRDLAMIARWHQCGTMTSQILARASFPPSVWPSSRSNFDLGPSPSDSTEKTLSYQSLWFWSAVFL